MTQRILKAFSALAVLTAMTFCLCEPIHHWSSLTKTAAAEKKPNEDRKTPPPLVVDTESPLLLDEPAADATSRVETDSLADNSACFVCHENYRREALVRWHTREAIGCVDCHGDSFAHRNDENNITPPDIMFPAAKIDPACSECHQSHDVSARKVIARLLKRCPDKTNPSEVTCTDCHGRHRLENRSVRWNRVTGKLLVDDEAQPVEEREAAQ